MSVPGARLSKAAPVSEVVNEKLGTMSEALPWVYVKTVADDAVGRAHSAPSRTAETKHVSGVRRGNRCRREFDPSKRPILPEPFRGFRDRAVRTVSGL